MNFALHGLSVRGYHLVNVALHAVCSALVGLACLRLFAPGDVLVAAIASLSRASAPDSRASLARLLTCAPLLAVADVCAFLALLLT